MRTFEFSDAKSHKFWTIDVNGNSFTVTYGKIGTAGQTQTKAWPTPDKAQQEADKLVREKTGKGYKETTPAAATAISDTGEVLLKAIIDDSHDIAAWSAYADYLQEAGDPRGEFMRVQLALEDESLSKAERTKLKKQEDALLKKHLAEWLGEILEDTEDQETGRPHRPTLPGVKYEFRRGWLYSLDYAQLGVEAVRRLSRSPQARLLQQLRVIRTAYEYPTGSNEQYADGFYQPGPDVPAEERYLSTPAFHPLCRCPHLASLRAIHLGEGDTQTYNDQTHWNTSCHLDGELAFHLIKQMPHVEEIRLHAWNVDGKKLFALPMPKLRHLEIFHSKDCATDKLAANKSLGNLEVFRFYPKAIMHDDTEPHVRLKQVRDIARAKNLPKLRHLLLGLSDFGDKGVDELISSGLLKKLKVLELRAGCISDAGATALAKCPDIVHLEHLNLDANALGEVGINALKKAKLPFTAAGQHGETNPRAGEGEFDTEFAEYFFTEGDIE